MSVDLTPLPDSPSLSPSRSSLLFLLFSSLLLVLFLFLFFYFLPSCQRWAIVVRGGESIPIHSPYLFSSFFLYDLRIWSEGKCEEDEVAYFFSSCPLVPTSSRSVSFTRTLNYYTSAETLFLNRNSRVQIQWKTQHLVSEFAIYRRRGHVNGSLVTLFSAKSIDFMNQTFDSLFSASAEYVFLWSSFTFSFTFFLLFLLFNIFHCPYCANE